MSMLILFCISLILGAVLYYQLDFSLGEVGIVSVFWCVLIVLLFRSRRAILLGIILGLSVLLGAIRFWIIPVNVVPIGSVALVGTVRSIDVRLDKTLAKVKLDDGVGTVQLSIVDGTELSPGDHISIRGRSDMPEDFVTDNGRVFHYKEYLASHGIDAVVRNPKIELLPSPKQGLGMRVEKVSTDIRLWVAKALTKYVAFPSDGVIAGMLVGFQGGIPKYISDVFRNTGTLHTLVLSGYNITILALFVGLLLKRAPYRIKNSLIFLSIISLVLISGTGVAALRAGIMGAIALLAGATLEMYNIFRSLVLAFIFFFFISPKTMFVDPGFQLSFLATFFIIKFLPILEAKLHFLPDGRIGLRETLILAIGLPIFMLPYMMYFSGLFPTISPIANIFMIPFIPVLMAVGLMVVIFSPIHIVSTIFGGVASFIGGIVLKVLEFFAAFPIWNTPQVSGFAVALFYTVLCLVIFRKQIFIYLWHLKNTFQQHSSLGF